MVSQAEIIEEEHEVAATNSKSVAALGMLFVTIGQMFHACHCIFEEHILQDAEGQEPYYMMGWEGIFGMACTCLIYLAAQFIGCPYDSEHCTANGKIDDIGEAFQQMN